MALPISFQGLSTGLQTDMLVNAILQQEGQPLQRMQDRQTRNNQRSTALTSLKTNLTMLASSLSTLGSSSFDARTVTSSDTNGTYASATATGAAKGSYDLLVSQVATRGRLSATLDGNGAPTNLAVADPLTTQVFTPGSPASFALQGTDGVVKTITLTEGANNLSGLRDAINASGAGVTAAVVNTGKGANPYQLVLTAKETGTGKTAGVVSLVDVTVGGAANSLGIAAGSVDAGTTPPTVTGGLKSAVAAKDAIFSVNGVELTRQSNVVTDAADGVTFTLKQGNQTTATTFTITQDKAAATTAMQDVVSKFNALVKGYREASGPRGALFNDPSAKAIIANIRAALGGVPEGLPGTAPFTSTASLGVKTNRDGSLTLDVTAFQAALDKDPEAVKRVFNHAGVSTNGVVGFINGTSKTATGNVDFTITSYVPGGAVTGTFTYGGTSYDLSGSNGLLRGAYGTPLEGLSVNVTGEGTGTLTISRGVGQAVRDLTTDLTSIRGGLSSILTNIAGQNQTLSGQISAAQTRLERRREVLQVQFTQMEAMVNQLKAAGQSLSGMG